MKENGITIFGAEWCAGCKQLKAALIAKGIEFDAVIIYDASKDVYGDESLRRLFYTACTRAMHHLQLYSMGEPSQILKHSSTKSLVLN